MRNIRIILFWIFAILPELTLAAGSGVTASRLKLYSDAARTAIASAATNKGAALVEFKFGESGAVSRTVLDKANEPINAKDFGVVGDGVADDTAGMNRFFAAANGKVAYIPTGNYKLTSTLSHGLSNTHIRGEEGQTVIHGSFGYAIFRLLASSNVTFEGITFRSDYVSSVEDTTKAVFYSFQASLSNIRIIKCTFSAPNANTSGFSIYLNPVVTDVNTLDGLWVEKSNFFDIGRIGSTIMNRNTGVGRIGLARHVYFNDNLGRNLGISGNYGFLLSLDGYGENFSVNYNTVENALVIGIENTGWIDGEIIGNVFNVFSRVYQPIAFGGNILGDAITGNLIANNRTLSAASAQSYFSGPNNSLIIGNVLETNGSQQALLVRDSNNNIFRNNYFKNSHPTAARYAVLFHAFASTCKGNRSYNDTFDTSNGKGDFATLRFIGPGATANVIYSPRFVKASGGVYADEASGAVGNLLVNASSNLRAVDDLDSLTQNFTADTDMTVTLQYYSASVLRITNSALTVERTVFMPPIIKRIFVTNATGQTLTFKARTGTGVEVAAGKSAAIIFNGSNYIRVTPDVK